MKKEDFKNAIRSKLKEVPVDTRKQWDYKELFLWWMETSGENPHLKWDRCPGDPWQFVKGMCKDLLKKNPQ